MAKESMKAREVKRAKTVAKYAAKRKALKEAGPRFSDSPPATNRPKAAPFLRGLCAWFRPPYPLPRRWPGAAFYPLNSLAC